MCYDEVILKRLYVQKRTKEAIFMLYLLQMHILRQLQDGFEIEVCNRERCESAIFIFDPIGKQLIWRDASPLTDFLKANEDQFRRLLHNKRTNTFFTGFKLQFSIIDGKDIRAFNDKTNLVVSDHGKVYAMPEAQKRNLTEIYTDGSYHEAFAAGGGCYLIKSLDGHYRATHFSTPSKSSSRIELETVIAALSDYASDVRIITDSQYVRKGITEWIQHWRHNGWTTANGTKAKNIEMWQQMAQLCSSRYVEFQWVKAHRQQFENSYCDLMAKAAARSKNIQI
jgi:ribonuclease HI